MTPTNDTMCPTGGEPVLRDRVPSAKKLQTEHPGAARAGSGWRRADGHVGRRRRVCARRARLEPCARARQFHSHCLLNYKVILIKTVQPVLSSRLVEATTFVQ